MAWLTWLTWLPPLLSLLSCLGGVEISYSDICGNKLHDSCPDSVNTKIIGGASTCAEAVPWNVLVENVAETRAPGKIYKTQFMVTKYSPAQPSYPDHPSVSVVIVLSRWLGVPVLWRQSHHLPPRPVSRSLFLDKREHSRGLSGPVPAAQCQGWVGGNKSQSDHLSLTFRLPGEAVS